MQKPQGNICFTGGFFAELVGNAAQNCYGVAAMAPCGTDDIARSVLPDIRPEKGVRVYREGGELCIELHIKVTYGVNIGAIVRSIIHKVKYAVEQATGLRVHRITVAVDDIV